MGVAIEIMGVGNWRVYTLGNVTELELISTDLRKRSVPCVANGVSEYQNYFSIDSEDESGEDVGGMSRFVKELSAVGNS